MTRTAFFRHPAFVSSIFTLLLLTTGPAFSGEPAATPPAAAHATPAKNTKPQIITDEKTNTVRIVIDGREVVTIDATGLHVIGDVDYTGIITDKGN